MNARQKKFAEYYAQSGNATRSAVKAGYSEKYAGQNADKLLKNTKIAEYIRQLAEKSQNSRIMTAKERQVLLSDIAKDIDLIVNPHPVNGEYIIPHTHKGYNHSENGTFELSEKERKMVDRINKTWYNYKNKK